MAGLCDQVIDNHCTLKPGNEYASIYPATAACDAPKSATNKVFLFAWAKQTDPQTLHASTRFRAFCPEKYPPGLKNVRLETGGATRPLTGELLCR